MFKHMGKTYPPRVEDDERILVERKIDIKRRKLRNRKLTRQELEAELHEGYKYRESYKVADSE